MGGLSDDEIVDVALTAFQLGLWPLDPPKPCHGYANGCTCHACKAIAAQVADRGFSPAGAIRPPDAPEQPWQAVPDPSRDPPES